MQIDPAMVTANDIRRYEKLMSGKAVRALSNAHFDEDRDFSEASNKELFTKHHWNIESASILSKPLELEFERPTSLIALNIELTFNCKDTVSQFAERLSSVQPSLSRV